MNPYDSPRADLTPSDWQVRRRKFRAIAKDRATFWAINSLGWAGLLWIAYLISMRAVALMAAGLLALTIAWELIAWGVRKSERR